jgi:hypothetical protein
MGLTAEIVTVEAISNDLRNVLFKLMNAYYVNVSLEEFKRDLLEKNWVLILQNPEGRTVGFSTIRLEEQTTLGQRVRIVFSGDTIIDRPNWGSSELPIAWGKHIGSLLQMEPSVPLYWILTTKGYKTFRFLPVFFKDYYPKSGGTISEFDAEILRDYATKHFSERYDSGSGILCAGPTDQRLRPGVSDIDASNRGRSDIAYFECMNPGHARGDELVCIARFCQDNIKSSMLKRIGLT